MMDDGCEPPGTTTDRRIAWTILALTLALVAAAQMAFVRYDTRTFIDHDYYYTSSAFRAYESIPSGRNFEEKLARWKAAPAFYPPLVPTALWASWTVVGPSLGAYRWVAALFAFVVVLGAGFALLERERRFDAALLAFLVATLPIVDEMSRKFFLQFQANAPLILAYALLFRAWTRPMRVVRFSAAVGMLTGLALATHPIAAVLALPLSAGFVAAIWSARKDATSRIGGPILAAALALAVVAPWVALHGRLYVEWYLTELEHGAPITRIARVNFFSVFVREALVEQAGPWMVLELAGVVSALAFCARRNPGRVARRRFLLGSIAFVLIYAVVLTARSNAANACSLMHVLLLVLAVDAGRDAWALARERAKPKTLRIAAIAGLAAIVVAGTSAKLGWIGRRDPAPAPGAYVECLGENNSRRLRLTENGFDAMWKRLAEANEPVPVAFHACAADETDRVTCETPPFYVVDRLRDAATLNGALLAGDEAADRSLHVVSLGSGAWDEATSLRAPIAATMSDIRSRGSRLLSLREECVIGLDGVHGRGLVALAERTP